MDKAETVIEIKNLHKSFGDLNVLIGVNISAKQGEVISLIGSSGSGKSTLLRCANLLENSQQGEIKFSGEKSNGKEAVITEHQRTQSSSVDANNLSVFQQFNLWSHMTVYKM